MWGDDKGINDGSGGGEVPPTVGGGVRLNFSINLDQSRPFGDYVKNLQYVIYNRSGDAVPKTDGQIIRTIASTATSNIEIAEALPYGGYTFCFLGSSHKISPTSTLQKLSDEWISSAIADRRPIDADIYYYRKDVDINQFTEIDIPMTRKVGQIEVKIANNDPQTIVSSATLKLSAGCLYNTITANGDYKLIGEQVDQDGYAIERDVLTTNSFFCLPTKDNTTTNALLQITYQKAGVTKHEDVEIDDFKVLVDKKSTITASLQSATDAGIKIDVAWGEQIDIEIAGNETAPDDVPGLELPSLAESDVYYWRSQFNETERKLYDYIVAASFAYDTNVILGYIDHDMPDGIALTRDNFLKVGKVIANDQPALFQCGTVTPIGYQGNNVSSFKLKYSIGRSLYNQQYKEVLRGASSILDKMPTGLDDHGKALFLHDEYLSRIRYGMLLGNSGDIFGSLGKFSAVCEGYARGYQYLLHRVGIQVVYVEGMVDTNSDAVFDTNHAWCIVRINGNYYHVDPTFDDAPSGSGFHHDNFLKSDVTMGKNHEIKSSYYPPCNNDYVAN